MAAAQIRSTGGTGGTSSNTQAVGGTEATTTGGGSNGGNAATGGSGQLQGGTSASNTNTGGAATGGTKTASATGGTTTASATSGTTTASATGGAAGAATGGTTTASATGGTTTASATGGTTTASATGGTTTASATGGKASTGGATTAVASGGVAAGGAATGGVAPTGGQASTGGTTAVAATGGAATGGAATGGTSAVTRYTLTVSFAGSGPGTVVIQPGNTTCTTPTQCTATFDSGTAVSLTAKPINVGAAVSSILSGWTGACAPNGPNRVCSLTINGATSTTARFDTLTANLAFVTSTTFLGNLGGAAAYQTQCNTLATAAGINNATNDAYIAWMAASNYAPATLLGSTRGWVRADLLPWIDNMATALSTGAVYYPVAYDENGQRVIANTLSGMAGNASLYTGYNCNDWTDSTLNTSHGSTHAGGKGWTSNNVGISSCGIASRVICVMKGANTPVTMTAAAGKRIYLTKTGWVPSGGLAGADAKCMTDAPSSVAAAKAVLVASTRALSDVLGATTVYVRPDGVKVGTGTEIIGAMNNGYAAATIEAAVTQDGGGNYVNTATAQELWTGLSYVGSSDKDTCRDWTSAASTDSGTAGGVATGWSYAGKDGSAGCNNNWLGSAIVFLQCAEQ